jgi:hypothetical protein
MAYARANAFLHLISQEKRFHIVLTACSQVAAFETSELIITDEGEKPAWQVAKFR